MLLLEVFLLVGYLTELCLFMNGLLPERMLSATEGLMASLTGTFSSYAPLRLLLAPLGECVLLRSLFRLDLCDSFEGDTLLGLFGISSSNPFMVPISSMLSGITPVSFATMDSFEESGLV